MGQPVLTDMHSGDVDSDDVRAVFDALRHLGVDVELRGGQAIVNIDGHLLSRQWAWIPSDAPKPLLGSLLDAYDDDTFVLSDRIPAQRAEQARERGMWYADATGRAYVRAPGVRIQVTPSAAKPARRQAKDSSSLLSPARAQVIFALLAWPELVGAPVRTLARISGTSDGSAQAALASLEADGYLTIGRGRLLRAEKLLRLWAGVFPRGLGRKQLLGAFTGTPDTSVWADAPYPVFVSGEAASDDILGPGLVLYMPRLDPKRALGAKWRGTKEPDPPIVVRRQFWVDPDTERSGGIKLAGLAPAPWPLVYADLAMSKDPRAQDVAEQIAERAWISRGRTTS